MSPPGRPKGEYRRAQPEGTPMSAVNADRRSARAGSSRLAAPDAAALWAELREATEARYDDLLAARAEWRPMAQRRLLLALELQWKLEELVLLPALQEVDAGLSLGLQSIGKEIELLRELAHTVSGGGVPQAIENTLFGVLQGIASLRAEQIEVALADPKRVSPRQRQALSRDIRVLLDRWRGEVETTGDIEDEEADPVGQPPR
jgi:hypothetical protein